MLGIRCGTTRLEPVPEMRSQAPYTLGPATIHYSPATLHAAGVKAVRPASPPTVAYRTENVWTHKQTDGQTHKQTGADFARATAWYEST